MSFVPRPVTVTSLELLRRGKDFVVRARSADGVEAITVPNPSMMAKAWPVLLGSVFPPYLRQDARRLEELHWEAYRHASNYKMQGQLFWSAVMAVEQALLELLARTAGRPVADLFGGARRRAIPVYLPSGNRGNTPAADVSSLPRLVAGSGVRALTFRLGGRISRAADSLPGRRERLNQLACDQGCIGETLERDAHSS